MATYLENLATYRDNLAAALAAWTGPGLKEISVTSPTGQSVVWRSRKDLLAEFKVINEQLVAAAPEIVYSIGR